MTASERHLRVVGPVPNGSETAEASSIGFDEDVGLLLVIFAIGALPLASAIAGVGRWDQRSLGLGAIGVLWSGRELWAALMARYRSRRRT